MKTRRKQVRLQDVVWMRGPGAVHIVWEPSQLKDQCNIDVQTKHFCLSQTKNQTPQWSPMNAWYSKPQSEENLNRNSPGDRGTPHRVTRKSTYYKYVKDFIYALLPGPWWSWNNSSPSYWRGDLTQARGRPFSSECGIWMRKFARWIHGHQATIH
jgi:hypothetical protein